MAGEELVYEVEDNDVPGLSPTSVKMQLTYFDTTVSASGDSEVEAMHAVSLEMLKVRTNKTLYGDFVMQTLFITGVWSLDSRDSV